MIQTRSDQNAIFQVYRYSYEDYFPIISTSHNGHWNSFMESDVQFFCNCGDFIHRCSKYRVKDKSLFLNTHTKKFLENKKLTTFDTPPIDFKIDPEDIGLCKHCLASMEDLRVNFSIRSYGMRVPLTEFKNIIKSERIKPKSKG